MGTWATHEFVRVDEQNQIAAIELVCKERLNPDLWWIDTGWYDCGGNWGNFGTWIPDPKRFPRGLRPVSDAAHAKGMKMITWFVPELANPGSWLAKNRPQWFEGGSIKFGQPAARGDHELYRRHSRQRGDRRVPAGLCRRPPA